eukprot:2685574-Rhodomonas_salina.2
MDLRKSGRRCSSSRASGICIRDVSTAHHIAAYVMLVLLVAQRMLCDSQRRRILGLRIARAQRRTPRHYVEHDRVDSCSTIRDVSTACCVGAAPPDAMPVPDIALAVTGYARSIPDIAKGETSRDLGTRGRSA